MTDPTRSPIAALAKKWRDELDAVKADSSAAPPLESWVEMVEELEAAIAAQVEVFERNEGVTCRAECIELLKGPKP